MRPGQKLDVVLDRLRVVGREGAGFTGSFTGSSSGSSTKGFLKSHMELEWERGGRWIDTLSSTFPDSESFLRINQSPDAFPWTLIVSLTSLSIDPNYMNSHYCLGTIARDHEKNTHSPYSAQRAWTSSRSIGTSLHVSSRWPVSIGPDYHFFGFSNIFKIMMETVTLPSSRLGTHEVLSYFIPVLFRHSSFDATLSDLFQPFINRRIFLRVS